MFSREVRRSEKENTARAAREQTKPSTSSSSRYPLNSITPVVNGAANVTGFHSGLKKPTSGLAQACSGSFNSGAPQGRRIVVEDAKTNTQTELFEDEFDSDVDIDEDFEEEMAAIRSAQPVAAPSTIKSPLAKYPTLPQIAAQQIPPGSSAPLPWSSSPARPEAAPALPAIPRGLGQTVQAEQNGPPPPQTKPKRKLPWATERDAASTQPVQAAPAKVPRLRQDAVSTPQRAGKERQHLWNTSASAVKEQQKMLREERKGGSATIINPIKVKSGKVGIPDINLSHEQRYVLKLAVDQAKSVFFTGSAGTGKSVLLRAIIRALRQKYKRETDRVAVTASTGLAACNIGGVTLHSFAGIGLGKDDVPQLVKKIKRNPKAKNRWMRTKVLIIDEISMVDSDLFDKLEAVARQIRNSGKPFGGIQLVITGDFFQLPPVPDQGTRAAKFAFDAATWNTVIEHTIALHQVFRQSDPVFAGMLNEMREGRLSQKSIQSFRGLSRELDYHDGLVATELFPTRQEVDRANMERLRHLQGAAVCFEARDGGTITDKEFRDRLLNNCMAPEAITLKKGAQVMLIKNMDDGLVNGSLGSVVAFMNESTFERYIQSDKIDGEDTGTGGVGGYSTAREYPVVRFDLADGTTRDLLCQPESWKVELPNGEVQASRSQIPLILAWALSIHKAQGQTLQRVKVDLGKVFEKGQAYVALSRATSMEGLQVLRFDPSKVVAHDRVRQFYSQLSRAEDQKGT